MAVAYAVQTSLRLGCGAARLCSRISVKRNEIRVSFQDLEDNTVGDVFAVITASHESLHVRIDLRV